MHHFHKYDHSVSDLNKRDQTNNEEESITTGRLNYSNKTVSKQL